MAAVAPEVSVIGATSLGGAAHRPEEASNHASVGRMYIPTGGGGRRCEAGCRGRKTGEDAPRALEPPLREYRGRDAVVRVEEVGLEGGRWRVEGGRWKVLPIYKRDLVSTDLVHHAE